MYRMDGVKHQIFCSRRTRLRLGRHRDFVVSARADLFVGRNRSNGTAPSGSHTGRYYRFS